MLKSSSDDFISSFTCILHNIYVFVVLLALCISVCLSLPETRPLVCLPSSSEPGFVQRFFLVKRKFFFTTVAECLLMWELLLIVVYQQIMECSLDLLYV